MQSTGNFIGMIIKFSAGMKLCHDHFQSRHFFFLVDTDRNPPTIIDNTDTVIRVNSHLNQVAKSGHGFIDAVIHNFVHQMVKSGNIDISNIHGRSLTNGFQSFQYFNIVFVIIIYIIFFFHILIGIITLK